MELRRTGRSLNKATIALRVTLWFAYLAHASLSLHFQRRHSLAFVNLRGGSNNNVPESISNASDRDEITKRKRKKRKSSRVLQEKICEIDWAKNITILANSTSSCNSTNEDSGEVYTIESDGKKKQEKVAQLKKSAHVKKGASKSKRTNSSNREHRKPTSRNSNPGKDGQCLRRIKSEWKDAVKLGIAYDWKMMQTVTAQGRSASGRIASEDQCENISSDDFYQYNYIRIGPFGSNLLRWHFSILGPANSVYSKGIYHGRILLPKDYPMSPPRVQMFTPSGRFHPGEDICLSASAFHPETWTPRWTILSLIDGLRIHMLTTANEIGGVDASHEKRRNLAMESRTWRNGPIDHGRMVRCGLFCDKDNDASIEINNGVKGRIAGDCGLSTKSADTSGGEAGAQHVDTRTVDRLAAGTHLRQRKTVGELIILISLRSLFVVLRSPVRLALLAFAIFHLFLRPTSVNA